MESMQKCYSSEYKWRVSEQTVKKFKNISGADREEEKTTARRLYNVLQERPVRRQYSTFQIFQQKNKSDLLPINNFKTESIYTPQTALWIFGKKKGRILF